MSTVITREPRGLEPRGGTCQRPPELPRERDRKLWTLTTALSAHTKPSAHPSGNHPWSASHLWITFDHMLDPEVNDWRTRRPLPGPSLLFLHVQPYDGGRRSLMAASQWLRTWRGWPRGHQEKADGPGAWRHS